MKASDLPEMQSRYLKAADVSRDVRLKVTKIMRENVDPNNPDTMSSVLYFDKGDKGLVLNVTNLKHMVDAFGDEMDSWIGRSVEVYVIDTEYKGKATKGLRLRVPEASQLGELDALSNNPPPRQPAPAPAEDSTPAPPNDNPPDAVRFPEQTEEEEWPF